MLRLSLICWFMTLSLCCFSQNILRIAAYGGELPPELIHQFEEETGIKVYLTTFESNENLLLKLKSSKQPLYDLITPSNYYVKRLKLLHMIRSMDLKKIPQAKYINPYFLTPNASNTDGIPFVWGATGLFYNANDLKTPPSQWSDLWKPLYRDKVLLLDDTREVFSMALFARGLDPNTQNPKDIQGAYHDLLNLIPNIKLLASDAIARIIVDEDALLGMAWNGDIVKIQHENPRIKFIFPSQGFIIWAECFSLPINTQNQENAYRFINFVLTPKHAAEITKKMFFPVTIDASKNYLDSKLANNPILYPSQKTLEQGRLQDDTNETIINLYNSLWETFKMSF